MQALRARFQLPFGAILHPLAEPQDVPVLNMCQSGIMRCNRCRTYVNPFNEWVDGGRYAHTRSQHMLRCPSPAPQG